MGSGSFASDWKFWVLTIPGLILLALVGANIRGNSANRALQADVVSRQQYINEATQLGRFNAQFIQTLASLAAQTNDGSLKQLLSDNGITYTVSAPAEPQDLKDIPGKSEKPEKKP